MKKQVTIWVLTLLVIIGISGCRSEPPLNTVNSVDIQQYAGLWYEIQRFPHSFEKNLSCVTANYTIKPDGEIAVQNRGKKAGATEFKEANGRAWVPDTTQTGRLKVSFFGPFAGDYQIMELSPDYQYVLIGAPSKDYLWILSRQPTLADSIITRLRDAATAQGFDVSRLETVAQDCW